jgi:aldehyde dehydrogenase (NAD+)
MHAGQGCALQTRLLVPRALMRQAAEIAAATVAHIPYGDPFDMNTMMGPLISERQFRRVIDYIELGKSEGRLVVGGGRAEQFDRGWFIQPTVIADVPNGARVAQEEIFGPVLVIVGFDDDNDAVRTANDSLYGLSGAVFSANLDRATAVAKRLRTGTVGVNGSQWFDPDSPFGGYKQSGLGREWGPEGLEDFLETKTMSVPG